jgi:periplasmic divalent cation tolerance protein
MAARLIEVRVNCPARETAERIAAICLADRLAASANILAPIESSYRWKGVIEKASEVPVVFKTRAELFDALCAKVKSGHPYEIPGIAATELAFVDKPYADWLIQETREPSQQ